MDWAKDLEQIWLGLNLVHQSDHHMKQNLDLVDRHEKRNCVQFPVMDLAKQNLEYD